MFFRFFIIIAHTVGILREYVYLCGIKLTIR